MNVLFEQNKYSKVYYSIIENSRQRILIGYSEKHHIIPKSLGGSNDLNNLAKLTAREHYICHLLLIKMVSSSVHRAKMVRALNAFKISSRKNPRNLTSKQYQKIRELTIDFTAWNKGKTLADYTPEQKEAFRKSGITKQGRPQTAESNAKRSATQSGRPAHNKGKTMPYKGRISPTKGMVHPKSPCPCCGTLVAANIMAKYHGNRCKLKG